MFPGRTMSRPPCVSCRATTRRGKWLKCMHPICLDCLKPCIDVRMNAKCPKCDKVTPATLGMNFLESLPDSDLATPTTQPTSDPQQVKKKCDECVGDKVAITQCLQCQESYCSNHGEAHKSSRKYFSHELVPLSAATPHQAGMLPAKSCHVHSSCKISKYCLECEMLLCELCCGTTDHSSHPDALRGVVDAAKDFKASLMSDLHGGGDDATAPLEAALAKAETAISSARDESENVSTQIQGYFEEIRKRIADREEDILKEVDRLSDKNLRPLEEAKQQLLLSVETATSIKQIVEGSIDDANFLMTTNWLQDAKEDILKAASMPIQPYKVGTLVFQPTFETELTTLISQTGSVAERNSMSPQHSSLSCPSTAKQNEEFFITVNAKDGDGKDALVTDDMVQDTVVEVATDAGRTTTKCALFTVPPRAATTVRVPSGPSSAEIVAKYTPTSTGRLTVTARHKYLHLRGSPRDVHSKSTFDPRQCHENIQLSNGNQTVTRIKGKGYLSVCGSGTMTKGHSTVHIHIDSIHPFSGAQGLRLCYCNKYHADLSAYRQGEQQLFGWCSKNQNGGDWKGTALGQPWKAGDVVTMTLDCDRHTLTGHHDRTGAMQTLTNVTGNLYLLVSLYDNGGQVTIV